MENNDLSNGNRIIMNNGNRIIGILMYLLLQIPAVIAYAISGSLIVALIIGVLFSILLVRKFENLIAFTATKILTEGEQEIES